jgi:diaminopimelate epimerase
LKQLIMKFTKMHGAGNDYVYVDCFQQSVPANLPELARQVSDRHKGVGGDGLILILPSDKADARMQMLNADGSEAEMCGNGIRCLAKYVYDHGIFPQKQMKIEAKAGVLSLELEVENDRARRVRVDMGEPILSPERIPTDLRPRFAKESSVIETPMEVVDASGNMLSLPVTCVSMGNPHCVIFVEEATDRLVLEIGPRIENDPLFPQRVNVEFVELISRTELNQRTWERGSGETLACGTGASAVCVAGVLTGKTERQILIHLLGGDLELHWKESDNHVYMTGPAEEVFSGEWP